MNEITLAGRTLTVPVLQGGMGVGVSMGNLAGSVAANGGMGTISTAIAGFAHPLFAKDPDAANLLALQQHIRTAKEIAGGAGMVAVNAMVATRQYAESVRAAVAAGVDAVVCGAGLALDLPALADDAKVALAPIVSGARAAALLCRTWLKRYGRLPDFVVVEGSSAGGHLGFSAKEVLEGKAQSLEKIVSDVIDAIAPYASQDGRAIPVFAGGSVFDGADMARFTKLGAAGVQIATRFIATEECDASQGYKDVILKAKAEDVTILHSPVGMPGRAINTPLLQKVAAGLGPKAARCTRCLTPCKPATTPFCIAEALIAAVQGDVENGLFFCGSNVGRVTEMTTVQHLLQTLQTEWRQSL